MTRTRNDLPTLPRRQSRGIRKAAGDEEQSVPDPSRIWTRPGFLIRRLHQIQSGLFLEKCGTSTITPLQFGMLTVLTEYSDGADIGTLAFQLGTDRSTTADVARRLARRGYIEQAPAKTDRRKMVSRITKEGRVCLRNKEPCMQVSQDLLLQPLSPKQRVALMDALRILVRVSYDKGRAKMRL